MNIQKKTVRIWLLIAMLSFTWGLAVPKLWSGMDSFSNLVATLVVLPVVVGLAYAINWAFSADSKP